VNYHTTIVAARTALSEEKTQDGGWWGRGRGVVGNGSEVKDGGRKREDGGIEKLEWYDRQ
jgi:hypothetical protein